ncbi:hypothetical protein GCM10027442_20310 [Emticicia fontis]
MLTLSSRISADPLKYFIQKILTRFNNKKVKNKNTKLHFSNIKNFKKHKYQPQKKGFPMLFTA